MLLSDNQLLILLGLLLFCVPTKHLGDDLKIEVKCRGSQMLILLLEINTLALRMRVSRSAATYTLGLLWMLKNKSHSAFCQLNGFSEKERFHFGIWNRKTIWKEHYVTFYLKKKQLQNDFSGTVSCNRLNVVSVSVTLETEDTNMSSSSWITNPINRKDFRSMNFKKNSTVC